MIYVLKKVIELFMSIKVVLASQSPARLLLLKQMGIVPDQVMVSDIDETEKKGEKPDRLALRLAQEKALAIANQINDAIIIGADTVPVCKGKIMRKAASVDDIRASLEMLSGRRHNVFTGVCVIKKIENDFITKTSLVKTIIKFRHISKQEIEHYAHLEEGIGKAGGYTLHGYAESFVSYISGSFSNVIGLPLSQTQKLLAACSLKLY